MNAQSLVENSVVAVTLLGGPTKIGRSLLSLPTAPEGKTTPESLGILCGWWIFTCAHHHDSFAMMPGDADLFSASCLNDPALTHGVFASLFASSMDFQILAPDGMMVQMSEGGGTETSVQMIMEFEEKYGAGLLPTEITFRWNTTCAEISGFFFGPDGKKMHRTRFKIWESSAMIEFFSNDFVNGCSGSPIFSDDNQLIGICTVASTEPWPNGLRHCLGVRIDQCMPQILQKNIRWERLVLPRGNGATDQPQQEDSPWRKLEEFAKKQGYA